MAFARKLWQGLVATRVAEVTVGTAGTPGPGRPGRRWWWRRRWRRHPQDHGRPGQDLLLLPPDVVRRSGVSRGHRVPAVLLILLLPDVVSGGALGSVHDLLSFSRPPLHHHCGHTQLCSARFVVVPPPLSYSHRDCRRGREASGKLILSAERRALVFTPRRPIDDCPRPPVRPGGVAGRLLADGCDMMMAALESNGAPSRRVPFGLGGR